LDGSWRVEVQGAPVLAQVSVDQGVAPVGLLSWEGQEEQKRLVAQGLREAGW